MTPDQRAKLEQVAREWLTAMWSAQDTGRGTVTKSLANLLASREAAVLEEVYEFVTNYHITNMTTTAKPALRAVTDIEDWLRQQAQERRA